MDEDGVGRLEPISPTSWQQGVDHLVDNEPGKFLSASKDIYGRLQAMYHRQNGPAGERME